MTSSPIFTLAFAAAAGVLLVVASTRLKIPSIALLLLAGVGLGPEGLGIIDPDALGHGLRVVVGMAVAIILFEGGLTLNVAGARRNPAVIRRLLSVGVLVTWLGTAAILWWLFALKLSVAVLCGSLVIVTGPTVISPLLRRIHVRDHLKDVLYWEAVLVDAIGVFIAVLCYEWMFPGDAESTWNPVVRFGARMALGAGVGVLVGALVALILHYHLVPEEQANIFVLAMALLAYGGSEAVLHEAGILAVIIAGLVVGLTKSKHLPQIKRFEMELTELGIGMLFILLAAKLHLAPFLDHGFRLVAAVAVLLLVLRPLAILLSTWKQGFTVQEKLFLSWVAPRGIVAAFMASLFSLELARNIGLEDQAEFLQTFTFAVIGTTVILQGLSTPWVARLLKVQAPPRLTWMFVGAGPVAAAMAAAMRRDGVRAIALAPPDQAHKEDGLEGLIYADPLDRELPDDPRMADVGAVVTLSVNPYFNQLVCQRWSETVGSDRCYRVTDPSVDGPERAGSVWGVPVWPFGRPPDALVQGVESGKLAFRMLDIHEQEADRFGAYLWPLLQVRSEANIEPVADLDSVTPGRYLALSNPVPGLSELIEDAVVIDDAEPTFEQVVEKLLGQAEQAHQGLPVSDLKRSIIEREGSMPTAMGAGVAIPHTYYEGFERSRCYVASVRRGLGKTGPDGLPVRLVFLVISPVGRAEEHLKSLGTIAHLMSDGQYGRILEAQETGAKLLERLMDRA